MKLQDSITTIKGIGEKKAAIFAKAGIHTIEELLTHYPRSYETYGEPVNLSEVEDGKKYSVYGYILSVSAVKRYEKYQVFTVQIRVGEKELQGTWFNMPFLRNRFQRGGQYVFRGTVNIRGRQYRMDQPETFSLGEYERLQHVMQPKYPLTSGLTGKMVVKAVKAILDQEEIRMEEYLPEEIRKRYGLMPEQEAVRGVHFPKDDEEMRGARDRLVFDEFLLFVLGIRKLKESQERLSNEAKMKETAETDRLIRSLPYELTGAQKRVWKEIASDLSSDHMMSRLVQGDVGSGKTILAVLALVMAGCSGYQGALMVPTEVLAEQHFQSICHMLSEYEIPLKAVLLTGSMTAKEKREAGEAIACGTVQIIIGTHALIQEKVIYQKLGLVVTDEQHRFGVRQREALANKGMHPHVLVMSATPIPRTLAIIVYGDLDISVVDELPADRLPIKNCVVDESYRPQAYRFMEKETALGHQVYIICPMVEESDEMELENVTDYTKRLKKLLPGHQIECLHGRMKPKEKNEIMSRFAAGKIQILVSTTVVEVGINVPEATVMMVENAERFGLAQLHQLRGRVGRGKAQSYCIFMSGSKGKETKKRLEVLYQSNDGFYIASEDLKLRGPGDLFGIRQSGILEFKLGDVFQDAKVLQSASEAAGWFLSCDPDLKAPKHGPLSKRLERYLRQGGESLSL
ncbi:MAG: ATP-dependent DNA helicase RecG [Lachnospiraceae bacterium]|nr:ATP-dependent DNA helicase RecG [Lachnospiraceae bacterium]